MATNTQIDVQKLYVAYFNRPADVDGLAFWTNVVSQTNSTTEISKAFAASDEYKAAFAGKTPSEVVTQVYKNLFGTTPDLAGLNFWATKLGNNTLSIDTIVKNIADGALGADKVTYANKVTAAAAFTDQLDTAAEIAAYAKPAASASAKAFISSITTDASLTAALVPATLAATVASVTQAGNAGNAFSLTTGWDNLVGTDGNDTFNARIFDNQNTLQSGDVINGGAGNQDRLNADIGNSQKFAITPETTGIEIASFRAQAVSTDSSDNNMNATAEVQIDAQRMVGVNQWESSNSRADLVIEDVRILDSQITKDITIVMESTDPGHVDFGVYFDQHSLRSATNSTNVLRLQLMDTRARAEGLDPLLNSPYNGFAFFYNGVLTVVQDPAIDEATTYEELLVAITDAVAKAGLTNVAVSFGNTFTVNDTTNGVPQSGTEILLTSTNGDTINATGAGAGWLAAGAVPPNSGLHTNMTTLADSSVDLVTSKVVLDDVGRGSMGGDLVIGGLSAGYTSESQGVQRFEIEVRDNSKLQTVSSTNNSLREVTIKNGVTTNQSHAYVETVKDKGNLTIAGALAGGIGNTPLPGSESVTNGYGLTDVRLIDASAMTGKLNLNAGVTVDSIEKYIDLTDTQFNPAADNIDFVYTGGSNDDVLNVEIDGFVAASNSLIAVGREDFTFEVNGGAGNDTITVRMIDGARDGNTEAWYANQSINANVSVNGGAGNDTIWTPGAGDVVINAGSGDDTVYVDNTGFQAGVAGINEGRATYVFNAVGTGADTGYNFFDLQSQTASSVRAVNAQLTVDFRGLSSGAVNIADSLGKLANVTITDLHINQAIKDAINNDAILNKLIVAEDGPARTLIVRSLIDGAQVTTDLSVTFRAADLNQAQLALTGTAAVTSFANAALIATAGYTSLVDGYVTNFAENGTIGSGGTPAVAEVQTLDFAGITLAVDESLTFNIGGTPASYANDTGAALTGTALASIIAGLTPVGYTLSAAGSVVTFTQAAGFESNIPLITAVNSEDGSAPITATAGIDGAPATAVGGIDVTGADSIVQGDKTVTGGTGDDVIVLGTSVEANDTVVYEAGVFGNDTIVNFTFGFADTVGVDQLDFTLLGGTQLAAGLNTDKSITIVAGTELNDTVAEIVALYGTTNNTVASTHVYVTLAADNNVGTVYSVTDAVGAGNVTVTAVGTIDLADTAWGDLTAYNFVGGTVA